MASTRSLLTLTAILALAGCAVPAASVAPLPSASATPEPTPKLVSRTPGAGTWAEDLARFDELVRQSHPSPWAVHSEAEWVAALERVGAELEQEHTVNEQVALVGELVGLLDSHSALLDIPGSWHFYEVLPYRFADGWFLVRATDPALVGSQLLSIGGVAIEDVVERLAPHVPHDNESGLLLGVMWLINSVEYLGGTGIVTDRAHPAFELRKPDGGTVTVDPTVVDVRLYNLPNPGWLNGPAPEAVARRGEYIWTRLEDNGVFHISVNDYGDMTAAAAELDAALDAGTADRVVLDMRYLPGGNGDISLLDTLTNEPRVNRDGGLTVLIGRENFSIATQVVYFFDKTHALLVGEPPPARAANFTCPCKDVRLEHSGFIVSVPQFWDYPGDERSKIVPDVPMVLSSADFFAGRDPVLEAALSGAFPAP